jgi:3-oxoacyl-[acyl-carrier-protein] synthase-3
MRLREELKRLLDEERPELVRTVAWAASIPMLLDEGVRQGRIRPGDLVAMASFGAGFSWTGALLRWS